MNQIDVPVLVTQWVDERYPRPRVDPSWLKECYEWIIAEKNLSAEPPHIEALLAELENQLLGSSLRDSMLHGTGLPIQIVSPNTKTDLTGPPVLVEITAITDVGVSAFQLEQVRKAREERILSGVGDEEGQEEGDLEVEGEGPMPKYPRGTLALKLFDGVTTLSAVEYKPLPELSLDNTPLGYKIQLKNVHIERGIAHLEPANVILKGNKSEADDHRLFYFKQNLRQRLGYPVEALPVAADEADAGLAPPALATLPAPRSALREISPPPSPRRISQRNDDEDLEPRRRRVPSSSPLPSSTARTKVATSPFFPSPGHKRGVSSGSGFSFTLSPTLRQAAPRLASPSSPAASDLEIDFALLDELEKDAMDENKALPTSSALKGKAKATDEERSVVTVVTSDFNASPFPRIRSTAAVVPTTSAKCPVKHGQEDHTSSDDYGMNDDSIGEDYLKYIEIVEMQALAKVHEQSRVSRTKGQPPTSSSASGVSSNAVNPRRAQSVDVITIDDDSDQGIGRGTRLTSIDTEQDLDNGMDIDLGAEDKENVPVATRHVRRRTADNGLGGGFGSQSIRGGGLSQRAPTQRMGSQRTRPVVLATHPDDIIDISDSD